MNKTSITRDHANFTLTIRRRFDAPRHLVWRAHTEPEVLDRWWAPKPYRAETVTMEFRAGGHWHYAMTSPEGDRHYGRMDYAEIEPEERIVGADVFADKFGHPSPQMPRQVITMNFIDEGNSTEFVEVVAYDGAEDLQKVIEMGIEDGLTAAQNQLEELLQSKN